MARIKIKDLPAMRDLSKKEINRFLGGTIAGCQGAGELHPELKKRLLPGYDSVNITGISSQFMYNLLGPDREPEDETGHGS